MSAPVSTPATNAPAPAPTPATPVNQEVLPHPTTLLHAARLAIQQDKPLQLDYYVDSATGKAIVGEDPETKEKLLVKSNNDEFTSQISKMYKVQEDFIMVTENSIYLVSAKIQKRPISASKLRSVDYEQL